MRILFTKRTFGQMGGSESLAFQFATRLVKRGHHVRVVCAQSFDPRPRYIESGVDIIRVEPRGGLLGMRADASTLVGLMPVDELARDAEGRGLIHNVRRDYRDSSVSV